MKKLWKELRCYTRNYLMQKKVVKQKDKNIKDTRQKKMKHKIANVNPVIWTIELNVNELKISKSEIIRVYKEQDPTTCYLQKNVV